MMLSRCFPTLLALAVAVLLKVAPAADIASAAETTATVIRLAGDGRMIVELVESVGGEFTAQGPGLIIWKGERGDFASPLEQDPRKLSADTSSLVPLLTGGVRSDGGSAAFYASPQSNVQDQLLGFRVTRGGGLLTPPSGAMLLDGRIVVRRAAAASGLKLPAAEYMLFANGKLYGTVTFPAGIERVDITKVELREDSSKGLPPGEYELRPPQGAPVPFTVADADHPGVAHLARLAEATGGRESELFALCGARLLLSHRNETGAAQPYLADALSLLERVPNMKLGRGAERLRAEIVACLSRDHASRPANEKPTEIVIEHDATGITAIDEARRSLFVGSWSEASAKLDEATRSEDARTRRLAALYQAVLIAESSTSQAAEATRRFREAIQLMPPPADAIAKRDLFRARNNFANFLASLALDRLQNQAFQAATGVRGPISDGLEDWHGAREQYEAALQLVEGTADAAGDRAAVQVNLAQIYGLLADIIRSVAASQQEKSTDRLIAQATAEALRYAQEALTSPDLQVQAAAHALSAELAFRAGDDARLRKHLDEARRLFLAEGILAGIESVERTSGLSAARLARTDPAQRKIALRHLSLSQELAEILRDELPADRIGLARAGFLARRVYVNERLIELRLAEGNSAEALRIAEAAKARALGDVLASSRQDTLSGAVDVDAASLTENWPQGVAALEYFIGTERGWVFVIGVNGKVTAHELLREDGKPLVSTELVLRTSAFLFAMRAQAAKMLDRLQGEKGFDHAWQDEAHWFAQRLLPPAALAELRKARTVIIVPHHVLHYFPFVALVTERDTAKRTAAEMVAPKFLLDEPFDVAFSPSLAVWRKLRSAESTPIEDVRAVGISDFLGRAPALAGVKEDLEHIRAAFGPRLKLLLAEEKAQQSQVLRAMENPGLLLFATHGSNHSDRPLESNLRLRADDSGDEKLTAADIYDADVGADLIVLSACFSGLADRSPLPSDDLFGVQRAFLNSGARAVVSGLWDVYDSSGVELMNSFFQRLAAGDEAPRALASAQRAFLAKYRKANRTEADPFIHPYFWAVYTSIGDDRVAFKVPKK